MTAIVGPSGAGKTSIAKKIISEDSKFVNSISVTTRSRRPLEVEGQDYYFVSKDEFKKMQDRSEFLEYAEVFDNYYGSPKVHVMNKLADGYDVLFDIDWQGAQLIKNELGSLVVSVFILPPSMMELEKRLKSRQSNSDEDVAKRMENAPFEISKYSLYDYVIINDNFDEAVKKVYSIIGAERIKRKNYVDFVEKLIGSKLKSL